MIYLRIRRITIDKTSNVARLHTIVLRDSNGDKMKISWSNDFNEFNIFDEKSWREYLANVYRLPNNKPLPSRTIHGERIVFQVYMYGSSREAQEYFGKKGGRGKQGGSLLYLFPGYDKETGKERDIMKYGWIRKD